MNVKIVFLNGFIQDLYVEPILKIVFLNGFLNVEPILKIMNF